MNKADRLNLIRSAFKRKPALTEQASAIIEELQKEDADLGGVASYGECLAADNVKVSRVESDDDESEANTEIVSPFMREIQQEEARERKTFESALA